MAFDYDGLNYWRKPTEKEKAIVKRYWGGGSRLIAKKYPGLWLSIVGGFFIIIALAGLTLSIIHVVGAVITGLFGFGCIMFAMLHRNVMLKKREFLIKINSDNYRIASAVTTKIWEVCEYNSSVRHGYCNVRFIGNEEPRDSIRLQHRQVSYYIDHDIHNIPVLIINTGVYKTPCGVIYGEYA